jgi:hypothetical protein
MMGCSIFIASSTQMRSPAATESPGETSTLTTVACGGRDPSFQSCRTRHRGHYQSSPCRTR